jgi:hypothetical protein
MTDLSVGSRTLARFAILIGCLIGLAACARPAESGPMTVTGGASPTSFPVVFQHAMCIRTVAGGESTRPLGFSKVGNKEFQTALSASMDNAGVLATPGACKFQLEVNLLYLSLPEFGLDFEVTSHVTYRVFNGAGQPVLLEIISAPFTATFDGSGGAERAKRANEGSIRANIAQFLNKLTTAAPT